MLLMMLKDWWWATGKRAASSNTVVCTASQRDRLCGHSYCWWKLQLISYIELRRSMLQQILFSCH